MFNLFETMEIFDQPIKETVPRVPAIKKKDYEREISVLRDVYSTVINKPFKPNLLGSKTIKSTKNERGQKHEFSSYWKNHRDYKYAKFGLEESTLQELPE